jgi:hypothetical protein
MSILSINARYAGSAHDAYVWQSSLIRSYLLRRFEEGDHSFFLLGKLTLSSDKNKKGKAVL